MHSASQSSAAVSGWTRIPDRWPLLAIAAFFLVEALIRFGSLLNHDTAWYLHVVRRLNAGEKLYTDIIEVNPPFGIWLTMPAIWLAEKLDISSFDAIYAMIFVSAGFSLFLANHFLGTVEWFSDRQRWIFIAVAAFAFLFLPGVDFGQREHFIVIFFFPWLVLRLVRLHGGNANPMLAALAGIAAAYAIALKPHAVFAPLIVEVFILWKTRVWLKMVSVENTAAAITAMIAGFLLFLLAPDFLTRMLAMGTVVYVPFLGLSGTAILMNAGLFLVLAIFAVWSIRLMAPSPGKDLAQLCLAAATGFGVSYFLQQKGYNYQVLPATAFAALGCAALLGEWRERTSVVFAVMLGVVTLMKPATLTNKPVLFQALIEQYAPNARSIFIANTNVAGAFPLVEQKRYAWASGLPAQWFAPYVKSRIDAGVDEGDPLVVYAREKTVSDLIKGKPEIIIVRVGGDQPYVPGGTFDYVNFWSGDSRFAVFWKNYTFKTEARGYAVYVRQPVDEQASKLPHKNPGQDARG